MPHYDTNTHHQVPSAEVPYYYKHIPRAHTPFPSARKVLHIQNPAELQTFKNVAGWLKEATGAQLEGVSLDEFRGRLSKAVEEKGPQDVGVLAQVRIQGSCSGVRVCSVASQSMSKS